VMGQESDWEMVEKSVQWKVRELEEMTLLSQTSPMMLGMPPSHESDCSAGGS
jgi:hypothetical protein